MKAVIMAGGEGTRLRPLTSKMPKPLAKILGESTLCHIIRLLKKHGIRDSTLTLMYMPQMIRDEMGGSFEEVNLSYFTEDKPLGTAGSVKNTEKFLLDKNIKSHEHCFLVISGDAICDIDLSEAKRFHEQNGADVTLVLSRTKNPLEFGGVITENNVSGKILSFIEKPAWNQVFTDTINTGIYIINNKLLDLIEDNTFYDFGRDFFPLVIRKNYKIYGYVDENYWCDIGDLDAYYNCNRDAVDGKIKIISENENFRSVKNKSFTEKSTLAAENSRIGKYTVTGKNCTIGENTEIENSIIGDNVQIGSNVKICGAIISDNVKIHGNTQIQQGCVIGRDSEIGEFCKISKGVKIWDNIKTEENLKIMTNIIFSNFKKEIFDDKGIRGDFNNTLTPEYCIKIGSAVGMSVKSKEGAGRVGVMYSQNIRNDSRDPEYKSQSKNKSALLIKNSLLCGICSSGAKSYDFGEGFDSLASFTAGHFSLDALLYIDRADYKSEDGNEIISEDIIKIYDKNTVYPSRIFERKLESALSKEDYQNPEKDELYETEVFDGIKFLYFSELVKSAFIRLDGYKVFIGSNFQNSTGTAPHIIKKALTELGADFCSNKNEADVSLYPNGEGDSLYACDKGSEYRYDFWHIIPVMLFDEIERGKKEFFMPYTTPHIVQSIAEEYGVDIRHYLSCSYEEDGDDMYIKSRIKENPYLTDACFAAVRLCCILKKNNNSIRELLIKLPEFNVMQHETPVQENYKTTLIKELGRQISELKNLNGENYCSCGICSDKGNSNKREGIRINYKNGLVQIIPSKTGRFRLIAESFSNEVSEEILSATEDRIKSIIENIKIREKKD